MKDSEDQLEKEVRDLIASSKQLFKSKNYDESIDLLKEVIEISPDNQEAKSLLLEIEIIQQSELKEKVKKNVLYIGILTIVMFFAGFTSAYVVMMSDAFWVKLKLPTEFWISTAVIIASSLTLFGAYKAAEKNNQSRIKLFIALTLFLGVSFTYFQFKGWTKLYEMGNNLTSDTLNPGHYGKDYVIRYKGDEVYFENNEFSINGTPVSEQLENEIVAFGESLYRAGLRNNYSTFEYNPNFIIVHKTSGTHLEFKEGSFYRGENQMGIEYRMDLMAFGHTLYKKVGYFFLQGIYGEDYTLMYNQIPVDYDGKALTINDKPLDANQIKMLEEHQNMTSTFVYLFSIAHWLHLFGGLIYLLVLFFKSIKGKYSDKDYLQIKLAGIYWHFLGILWVYLFLFLQFIH